MSALPAAVRAIVCVGLLILGGCAASEQPIDATEVTTPAPMPPAPGLADFAGPISEAMFQHPDQFGGKPWYDREGKFLLHVAYVGDEAAARAFLAPVIPANVPVEFHRVKYSYLELEAATREIFAANSGGMPPIDSISIESETNRLTVRFADHDYPDLRQLISDKFGDMVTFDVVLRGEPL